MNTANNNEKFIVMEHISKVYSDGTKALDDVSLEVKKGEFIAIMGPSGSGKSTLLNIIGCMDSPTAGEYYLSDNDMLKDKTKINQIRKKYIGFIFQHFALMEYYTAFENIEVPLLARNIPKKKRNSMILEQMKRLNIEHLKNKKPNNLSGGEKQRVAIARALVADVPVILADEPTGALDQNNGQSVLDLLKQINKEGKTVIVVTHDEKIALQMNRIIKICDGKIESDTSIF